MTIKDTAPVAEKQYTLVLTQSEIELLNVATRFISAESREDGAELESLLAGLTPHLRGAEERAYTSVVVGVQRLLRKVKK